MIGSGFDIIMTVMTGTIWKKHITRANMTRKGRRKLLLQETLINVNQTTPASIDTFAHLFACCPT